MKTLLITLLAVSFVSVAVFGIFMMHGGSHEICPISSARVVDCIKAIPSISLANILTLIFAVLLISLCIVAQSLLDDIFQYSHRRSFLSNFKILSRHWFSLLEHSPTA